MRVFLGPYHVASILWEYKRGLSKVGVDAQVVVFHEHRFGYPADITFGFKGNRYLQILRRIPHFPRLISQFDFFHFVYGSSLLPYPYNFDVPLLKAFKKKIVMSFLGSDIRCSEEVMKGYKKVDDCQECFLGYESRQKCNLQKKIKLVKFWSRNADAIFCGVGYSQILDALSVKYHPLIVPCDLTYWKPFQSDWYKKKSDETLVLHAPTEKRMKGEKFVVRSVQRLKNEGYNIKFILLKNVPNYEVREWLNVSDIVVDQLLGGWHGMFAVESMAMAKPTICYVNERYKKQFEYAKNIPLVNAAPKSIYQKLKMLIENPKLRREIGYKSRKYAEMIHDSRKVAKQLLSVYNQL